MFDIGFPRDWSSLKKLIWLKAAISGGGASAVWKTVSGTLIHITDALASPMQKCEVTLEPIQDLHGQDAPYPAGGGANKLQVTGTTKTVNGVTFTVGSDGVISCSGNASATAVFDVNLDWKGIDGITYILSGCPSGGGDNSKFKLDYNVRPSYAVDIGSGAEFVYSENTLAQGIRIVIYSGYGNNLVFKPMIRLSSVTDDTFAPYSNICPITGWTGCEVNLTGKNLFDVSRFGNANNLSVSPSLSTLVTTKIFIKAGSYTFSLKKASSTVSHAMNYIVNGSRSSLAKAAAGDIAKTITANYDQYFEVGFITTGNTEAQRIQQVVDYYANGLDDDWQNIQLTIGSTAPDSYSPYIGTTASVTFPDTVYGGSHEFVGGESIKTHNRLILKDLTWYAYQPLNSGGYRFVAYPFTSESVYPKTGAALIQNISNVFSYINPNTFNADTPYYKFGVYSSGTNRFVQISHPAETVEDLITSLTELDAILVYEVANPTEISLTPQEISTLAGENNVWSNGDSVEITYKAQSE